MKQDTIKIKIMDDYSKGKIYMMYSVYGCIKYVGYTLKSLEERFEEHKKCYELWKEGKYSYTTSYEVLVYSDAKICLLYETKDAKSLRDIRYYETKFINGLSNTINFTTNNFMTREEWDKIWKGNMRNFIDKKIFYDFRKKMCPEYYYLESKICGCGGSYCDGARKKVHIKTQKHQSYIKGLTGYEKFKQNIIDTRVIEDAYIKWFYKQKREWKPEVIVPVGFVSHHI